MKTRKTAWNNRKTYVYENSMGKDVVIKPGMVDKETGYVFTREDVRLLHAMDDAEVYNNLKNRKPKSQPWQEKARREWQKANPGKELPSTDVLSLDDLYGNEEGGETDVDKGGTLGRASMVAYMNEEVGNPLVERMREIVMEMGEKYWRLYVLYAIKKYTFEEIAQMLGIGTTTAKDWFRKVKQTIKCKMDVNF